MWNKLKKRLSLLVHSTPFYPIPLHVLNYAQVIFIPYFSYYGIIDGLE